MRKNASPVQSAAGPDMSHNPALVQNRILQYAADHPETDVYPLSDAVEASELLLALAAVIQLNSREMPSGPTRDGYRATANQMRKAVIDAKPMEYLRGLGELEAFGLKIQLPPELNG